MTLSPISVIGLPLSDPIHNHPIYKDLLEKTRQEVEYEKLLQNYLKRSPFFLLTIYQNYCRTRLEEIFIDPALIRILDPTVVRLEPSQQTLMNILSLANQWLLHNENFMTPEEKKCITHEKTLSHPAFFIEKEQIARAIVARKEDQQDVYLIDFFGLITQRNKNVSSFFANLNGISLQIKAQTIRKWILDERNIQILATLNLEPAQLHSLSGIPPESLIFPIDPFQIFHIALIQENIRTCYALLIIHRDKFSHVAYIAARQAILPLKLSCLFSITPAFKQQIEIMRQISMRIRSVLNRPRV